LDEEASSFLLQCSAQYKYDKKNKPHAQLSPHQYLLCADTKKETNAWLAALAKALDGPQAAVPTGALGPPTGAGAPEGAFDADADEPGMTVMQVTPRPAPAALCDE
jgi:hypothetical protein